MRIGVIGGGIIGVNCALALRSRGVDVTIVDPAAAKGASKGNAGCFAFSEITPVAMPGLLAKVPAMLRNPHGPLAVRWSYMPRLAPWLARFLRASSQRRIEQIADALAQLAGRAEADYAPVLASAGLGALVARKGALFAFSNPSARTASREEWRMKASRGIGFEILDGRAMREMEPALGPRTIGGYHVPGWSHTSDPFALTAGLLKHFTDQGGHLVAREVEGVRPDEDGVAIALRGAAPMLFDHVVVAAGARSGALLAPLGLRVPLDTERGYNTTLPKPGVHIERPVCIVESGYFMTPMAMGLRIGGGVELAGLSMRPNWRRADIMVEDAQRAIPGLDARGGERWIGFRPSMPDSLPVIGRAPAEPRILLAFGHGHLGLTFGATTGRLIADLACEAQPSIELRPFQADRFH